MVEVGGVGFLCECRINFGFGVVAVVVIVVGVVAGDVDDQVGGAIHIEADRTV